ASSKTGTCTITVKAPVSYTMKLSEYNKNLTVGEKSTLSAWVEPKMPLPADGTDRAIVYRSSNTKVATVSSTGEITAVAVGSAEILVETDGVKSAVCTVNVTGKAELTLVKKPTKTTYYLGDSIDTNGLKLGYTDMYGKYTVITNGYTVSGYDLHRIGTQTVKVQYAGLMITFDLTVKTPSITINKLQIKDVLLLAVQTEPEGQKFDIWSSNREVFVVSSYLGSSYVAQPTGEGTAYAHVSMVYNGIEYSDYVSVTVERIAEEHHFNIFMVKEDIYNPKYSPELVFSIDTSIPDFNIHLVKWSVKGQGIEYSGTYDDNYYHVRFKDVNSVEITATYSYNEKIYTDTYLYEYEYEEVYITLPGDFVDLPGYTVVLPES
ncbi:MAG: bacterial Ig-like domain-containing protein, partial [Clostridia bacterium]|nr:bacterial Ig-like domain-containing protein [Clostridia bacterium]